MRQRTFRGGAALVEFALILPVILLLFAGFLEVFRVVMLQHTADTAAYEGARTAIIPGACSELAIASAIEVIEANQLENAEVTVEPQVIEDSTATVTVFVSIPIDGNSWISPFFTKGCLVRQEVTLLAERPTAIKLTGIPNIGQPKTEKAEKDDDDDEDDEDDD